MIPHVGLAQGVGFKGGFKLINCNNNSNNHSNNNNNNATINNTNRNDNDNTYTPNNNSVFTLRRGWLQANCYIIPERIWQTALP